MLAASLVLTAAAATTPLRSGAPMSRRRCESFNENWGGVGFKKGKKLQQNNLFVQKTNRSKRKQQMQKITIHAFKMSGSRRI